MKLIPLPAFADNYIWMLHDEREALVVDPGDAQPVLEALRQLDVQLKAILVTHHHADHTGGVDALRKATGATVYGPAFETLPEPVVRLAQDDQLQLLGLQFSVMAIPGHTLGHIAFFCAEMNGAPLLFCGDTLFSAGCGRVFEGSAAQMLASLDALASLPDSTRVCCAHEYTLANLKFACVVDPDNLNLAQYAVEARDLRQRQLPTLPSTMVRERQVNPFLRTRQPAIIRAVQAFDGSASGETGIFAALRQWKNQFK